MRGAYAINHVPTNGLFSSRFPDLSPKTESLATNGAANGGQVQMDTNPVVLPTGGLSIPSNGKFTNITNINALYYLNPHGQGSLRPAMELRLRIPVRSVHGHGNQLRGQQEHRHVRPLGDLQCDQPAAIYAGVRCRDEHERVGSQPTGHHGRQWGGHQCDSRRTRCVRCPRWGTFRIRSRRASTRATTRCRSTTPSDSRWASSST